jgi:hypothetical protein
MRRLIGRTTRDRGALDEEPRDDDAHATGDGLLGAVVAVPTAAALVRAMPYLLGRRPIPEAGADRPRTQPPAGVGSPP